MSDAAIWMPIYIGDYLADTASLSTEQHGAYFLLMMHQWRHGIIPRDDASLAHICRCSVNRWKQKIAGVLLPFFTAVDGGLMQTRLQGQRERAQKISGERSAAAHQKWNRIRGSKNKENNGIDSANAADLQMPGISPSQSQSPNKIQDAPHPGRTVSTHESKASAGDLFGEVKRSERKSEHFRPEPEEPPQSKAILWRYGPDMVAKLLGTKDMTSARSFLGALRGKAGNNDIRLLEILQQASSNPPIEAKSFLIRSAEAAHPDAARRGKSKPRAGDASWMAGGIEAVFGGPSEADTYTNSPIIEATAEEAAA